MCAPITTEEPTRQNRTEQWPKEMGQKDKQ